MIMIICHHFSCHGGFDIDTSVITVNRCWYYFLLMGGKIGVDIFVLISGYFLVDDDRGYFNLKRILKFVGQVVFYSVVLYLLSLFIGKGDFGKTGLIKSFFPLLKGNWWFASTYFVMYLVHPFINKMLKALDKKGYQILLITIVICWSLIPTFLLNSYQMNNLIWFIALYCIAGYIKRFGFNPKFKTIHYFVMFVIFFTLTFLSSVIFSYTEINWGIFGSYITFFFSMEKISVLLISLTLFMFFATVKIPYIKWVNIIASTTFGIYLIHDSNELRSFLWINVFKNATYYNSDLFIPYSIAVVAIVFIGCAVIDLLRQYTVEKIYLLLVNKCSEAVFKPFGIIINFFANIIFGKEEK